jgi:hypothetical protein
MTVLRELFRYLFNFMVVEEVKLEDSGTETAGE